MIEVYYYVSISGSKPKQSSGLPAAALIGHLSTCPMTTTDTKLPNGAPKAAPFVTRPMAIVSAGEVSQLLRPCVDCGLVTGNFCENGCLAFFYFPSETWAPNQITPQCTYCEIKYEVCHCCRGVSMCTPPAHRQAPSHGE